MGIYIGSWSIFFKLNEPQSVNSNMVFEKVYILIQLEIFFLSRVTGKKRRNFISLGHASRGRNVPVVGWKSAISDSSGAAAVMSGVVFPRQKPQNPCSSKPDSRVPLQVHRPHMTAPVSILQELVWLALPVIERCSLFSALKKAPPLFCPL